MHGWRSTPAPGAHVILVQGEEYMCHLCSVTDLTEHGEELEVPEHHMRSFRVRFIGLDGDSVILQHLEGEQETFGIQANELGLVAKDGRFPCHSCLSKV